MKKNLSDTPDIVVGIPAYNEEKYLARTIIEYLKQVGAAVQIIVVDNASTDKTSEIARIYYEIKMLFILKKNDF